MPANKTIAAVVIQHILSHSTLASRTDWRKHTHNIQQQRLLYESSSPSALPAHHSTNILLRSPSSYGTGCSSLQQHRAGSNNKNKVRRWFEKHFFHGGTTHNLFSTRSYRHGSRCYAYKRLAYFRISQWHKQESKLFRSKNSISTAGGISRKFFLFWHTIVSENCHCGEQNERVTKCILILKMHLLKNASMFTFGSLKLAKRTR